MRIRFGVGLPGPFRLTGGRSRGRGGLVFVLAVLGLVCLARPVVGLVLLGLLAVVVVCVVRDQRRGIPLRRR